MNKRIEKKVTKREAAAHEAVLEAQGIKPLPEALKDVSSSAETLVRSVIHEVGESIAGLKSKVANLEQQAEAVISRVPGVGELAAKKLHEVTH